MKRQQNSRSNVKAKKKCGVECSAKLDEVAGTQYSAVNDINVSENNVAAEVQTGISLGIAERLLCIELEQAKALLNLKYPHPVAFTYNPLEYALETHSKFIHLYCTTVKPLLFMGINPGPFGMAQTGVPFGEVSMVKNWIKITGRVGKPVPEHPKRPIEGFDCSRNEVSGQRFWGYFQDLCKTPEVFFRNAFVHNYCPLLFMRESAKNITPNELPAETRKKVQEICDYSLLKVVKLLQVKAVVGLGRFAQSRAKAVLDTADFSDISVGFLMHPSPINPAANKGWKEVAQKQLTDLNVMHYLT